MIYFHTWYIFVGLQYWVQQHQVFFVVVKGHFRVDRSKCESITIASKLGRTLYNTWYVIHVIKLVQNTDMLSITLVKLKILQSGNSIYIYIYIAGILSSNMLRNMALCQFAIKIQIMQICLAILVHVRHTILSLLYEKLKLRNSNTRHRGGGKRKYEH